jgi:hypothetical protein
MNSGKPFGKGKLVAASIAVVLILAAGRYYNLPGLLAGAMTRVAAQGVAGIAAYVVLYVVVGSYFSEKLFSDCTKSVLHLLFGLKGPACTPTAPLPKP